MHQIICVYYKCLLSTKYDKRDNQSNYYTNTSIITIYCFDRYIFQTKYVLNEIFFYFPANSYLPRKYFLKVISSSLYEYFRMKYCFTYKLRNISNHMHFYFYKYFCGKYNPLPESIYISNLNIIIIKTFLHLQYRFELFFIFHLLYSTFNVKVQNYMNNIYQLLRHKNV